MKLSDVHDHVNKTLPTHHEGLMTQSISKLLDRDSQLRWKAVSSWCIQSSSSEALVGRLKQVGRGAVEGPSKK